MQTQYFPHDYHARHDPKLLALRRRHGLLGLGAYWCLVEALYEQGGALDPAALEDLAYDLRLDPADLRAVVEDFDLFQVDAASGQITSATVGRRLAIRQEKAEKAGKSARARWSDANALRTQSDRTATPQSDRTADAMLIKEKGKERKEKKKESKNTTSPSNLTRGADAPETKPTKPSVEEFRPTGLDKALLERADVAAAWAAFLENRRRHRWPCTPYALGLIVKKLRELRGDDGPGWAELLDVAVERGWRSVFEPRDSLTPKTTPAHDLRPTPKPTLADRYNDRARDLLAGL